MVIRFKTYTQTKSVGQALNDEDFVIKCICKRRRFKIKKYFISLYLIDKNSYRNPVS